LAGFNGLEAGQGIIILSFLSLVAYLTGSAWLAIVGLCMVAALLGFYFYNKFPAEVFPGDIMTYSIGALIAGMAIVGNFEKIAVFVFIPYIIETGLKLRGKLKKQSFGKPQKDGNLKLPFKKFYGLTHVSIWILSKFKKKVYEKDVVYLIFGFQILLCLIALFLFRGALF
jgi:UDP-N-acetylglucosamine--dolichyl-phosphate N-acetylglucosaminephosphotransferase